MKPSERLRGRADAFQADHAYVAKKLKEWRNDETRDLDEMKERGAAYEMVACELRILADELEREGS